jgi:hypothetical protein
VMQVITGTATNQEHSLTRHQILERSSFYI